MERSRSKTLKLFVVSDIGRRSLLLSSTRSVRSWQSFLLRSAAPSPASCLWPPERRRTLRRDLVCSKPPLPHQDSLVVGLIRTFAYRVEWAGHARETGVVADRVR